MWISRRVSAFRAVVATFVLVGVLVAGPPPALGGPRWAAPERPDGGERLVQVELDGRVVQLVADGDGTCALTEAGQVYCWGATHPDPYRSGANALVLVALGSLLVAGGVTLLLLSRFPVNRRPPAEPHPGAAPPPV